MSSSRAYINWHDQLEQRNRARDHAINYGMGNPVRAYGGRIREHPTVAMAARIRESRHTRRMQNERDRRESSRARFTSTPVGHEYFYDYFNREGTMSGRTADRPREERDDGMDAVRYATMQHRARANVEAYQAEVTDERLRGLRLPEGMRPEEALETVTGRLRPHAAEPPPAPQEFTTIFEGNLHFGEAAEEAEVPDEAPEIAPLNVDIPHIRAWQNPFVTEGDGSAEDSPPLRDVSFMEILDNAHEITIYQGEDGIFYGSWQTRDECFGTTDAPSLNELYHKILTKVEKYRNEHDEQDCEF